MTFMIGQTNSQNGYKDALYENDNDARSAARAIDLYKEIEVLARKLRQRVIRVLLKQVNTQVQEQH